MNETLWYYADTKHMAAIIRKRLIFELKGEIVWLTSNPQYHLVNAGTQYRIQVTTDAVLGSYNVLKLAGRTELVDHIERSNPEQWFGTRQLEFDDKKTPMEALTSEGWVRIDGPRKQYLINMPLDEP